MFSILIHRKALKEIDGFSAEDKERILSAIRQMATEPFSGDIKPIKGVKGVLRRRVGDYRIAFTVNFEKSEVIVLRVGRRERFYQEP
jgi:mRNA-degrading endonuclease RelE of RelBE toxin-antitoxin system